MVKVLSGYLHKNLLGKTCSVVKRILFGRQPLFFSLKIEDYQIFLSQMEDNLNLLLQIEYNINFWKLKDNLIFGKMEDILNISENGRLLQFFETGRLPECFAKWNTT
jgi:hypothetical protein